MATDPLLDDARRFLAEARKNLADAESGMQAADAVPEMLLKIEPSDLERLHNSSEAQQWVEHLPDEAGEVHVLGGDAAARRAEHTGSAMQKAADAIKATEQAAFALQVHLELESATSKFRAWQQIPGYVMGAAGVAIAFLLLFIDPSKYVVAAWLFSMLLVLLSVVLMFRGKTLLDFGTGGDGKTSSAEQADNSTNPTQSTGANSGA